MDRDKLGQRALGWKGGYKYGLEVMYAENLTREEELIKRSIRIGHNQIIKELEQTQWGKLFGIVVIGSVIGCGIELALALGFASLPR
jgi:hypothetical protein